MLSLLLLAAISSCEATTNNIGHAIHPRTQGNQLRRRKNQNQSSPMYKISGGKVQRWEGFREQERNVGNDEEDIDDDYRGQRKQAHVIKGERKLIYHNRTTKGSKKGNVRSRKQPNPRPPPPPPPDTSTWPRSDQNFNALPDDSDAQIITLSDTLCTDRRELSFFQLSGAAAAVNPVFINYAEPDESNLGTVYIYNDALFDGSNLAELQDSFATGHCVRTQTREGMGEGSFVSGGGYCHFTYTLSDGQTSFSFNAVGEVFDSFGGQLVITGGTNTVVGATGEINLAPLRIADEGSFQPSSDDFFMGADIYQVTATINFNSCREN